VGDDCDGILVLTAVLQDTVWKKGVKLSNLVQISHNVHIGKHTAIGCAGVAGSAVIGCPLLGWVWIVF
jgi:UDP-3-O-[3-hydroxymyristoyl] glucosamine N-acyltransferase